MNRTTRLTLILCISVSCGIAHGQDSPPVSTTPTAQPQTNQPPAQQQPEQPASEPPVAATPPANEGVPAPAVYNPAKAVVSVINPDAKRSEAIQGIVDALEKSGIERSDAPADQNWNDDRITARIRMRLDTPYEKVTALIKALQYAGVRKLSLTNPTADGKNMLFLVANAPQRKSTVERINRAARQAAEENDLQLDVISTIPAAADTRATVPEHAESPAHAAKRVDAKDSHFEVLHSDDGGLSTGPAANFKNNTTELPDLSDPRSAEWRPKQLNYQIEANGKLYDFNNNEAHELAESLRQTPNARTETRLRSAVMRSLRSRQEVLQAELLQMQYRLNQTQATLTSRKQIRSQIVDRRVQELLNPQLDWETSRLIDPPKELQPKQKPAELKRHNSFNDASPTAADTVTDSGDNEGTPGLKVLGKPTAPEQVSVKTELEGDWHQVAYSDGEGDTNEKHMYNRTFNGNHSVTMWPTGRQEERIEVNSTAKTIRSFHGDQGNHSDEQYELQGDRLVILEPGFIEGDRITVYERGHLPFSEDVRLLFAPSPDAP